MAVFPNDVVKAPVDLKPCPFCGSNAVHLMQQQEPQNAYNVYCIACGTIGPGLTGPDPQEVQACTCDQWNYRVCDGSRKPAYYAICPVCFTEFRTRADYPTCPDCGYQFDDSD